MGCEQCEGLEVKIESLQIEKAQLEWKVQELEKQVEKKKPTRIEDWEKYFLRHKDGTYGKDFNLTKQGELYKLNSTMAKYLLNKYLGENLHKLPDDNN